MYVYRHLMRIMSEEEITTYEKLVNVLREQLFEYIDRIVDLEAQYLKSISVNEDVLRRYVRSLADIESYMPNRMVALDGGSANINMEIGHLGLYVALAVVFPEMRRIYLKDSCGLIPSDPTRISEYVDPIMFNRLLDLRRERKVFELACYIARNMKVDVILIDGPLIPTPKIGLDDVNKELSEEYDMYFRAIRELHRICYEKEILLIGFVKRARSKLIMRDLEDSEVVMPEPLRRGLLLPDTYDTMIVDLVLKEGELFPYPPMIIKHNKAKYIQSISCFIKVNEDITPFRVDIAGSALKEGYSAFERGIGLIKEYMTSYGVPYPILKVDEEVKLSRRLIRELYDDLRYRYFSKVKDRIVSIKTIWGESL
ncbi:MAG: hypothetical protein DRZ82_07625 [Thermoprotei archaeon]|nr:MAG: hypothetical protein DRZ82_07625 [Thermoprotei archaeon]